MEESFSASVFGRLPAAIRELSIEDQKLFIHMRLGRKDEDICRLMGFNEQEYNERVIRVREVVTRAGILDLIENPQFVSIDSSHDEEDYPSLQLVSPGLMVEKKLVWNEFLSFFKEAVEGLPPHMASILRLRYNQEMSAREILGFSKKAGISLVLGKGVNEITEQDVFYAINKAIKEVFHSLKHRYGEDVFLCQDGLRKIMEEIDI